MGAQGVWTSWRGRGGRALADGGKQYKYSILEQQGSEAIKANPSGFASKMCLTLTLRQGAHKGVGRSDCKMYPNPQRIPANTE